MSDTSKTQDPYQNGEVPADADVSPDASDVLAAVPGAERLAEGDDEPEDDAEDMRPEGGAPLP